MNTNGEYNNEKKSNVKNASKNNVNNTNAESKSGNDEIEFEIKDIEIEPTNVKISGKADIKFEELPSSNTEESKNVLDDYMEDLSDNNVQKKDDSIKNETKSTENDENAVNDTTNNNNNDDDQNKEDSNNDKEEIKEVSDKDKSDEEKSDKNDENQVEEKTGKNNDNQYEKKPDADTKGLGDEKPNKDEEKTDGEKTSKDNEKPENVKNNDENKNQPQENKPQENPKSNQDNQKNNKSDKNDQKDNKKPKSSSDEKRQEAKNKQENNRNRNNNNNNNSDNKGSLKDRIKNKANPKNLAKQAANKTKTGQAVNNVKDKVDKTKKTVKAIQKIVQFVVKYWYIVVAVLAILIVALVIIFIIVTLQPGPGGDVNDSDNTSNYSKADQKTLQKMRKLFAKYPNADGTLAMVTVLYPYFSTLHDGNVLSYLEKDVTDEEPVDVNDDTEEIDADNEDVDDDANDKEENDMYLQPLRKSKIRRKLKKILKELNGSTEEQFKEYLKDNYFKKDKGYSGFDDSFEAYNGYKEMFDSVKSEVRDELADAVIEELYAKKDLFLEYVYTNIVCSTASTSLGYSDGGNLIRNEMYVTVYNSSSLSPSDIYKSELSFKDYIMGVTYAEIDSDVEAYVKAQMIAAKSFTLGRTQSGSSVPGIVGMGRKYDDYGDKIVFHMASSTNDQVYCDVYDGCSNKPKLPAERLANYEKWFDEIKDEYIYDSDNEAFGGSYASDYGIGSCTVGSCLSQTKAANLASSGEDYKSILYGTNGAYSESRFTEYDASTSSLAKVSGSCVGVSSVGGCEIPEDKFVYYSQRSYKQRFCGRSDNSSISSSGCGVTSMAMVLANLTDEGTTPLDTNEEARQAGYCGDGISGTAPGYLKYAANKHGLTYDSVLATAKDAEEKVKKTLNSGGLVIASVGLGWKGSSGHYLVIKGVTQDGKLIIADPMDNKYNERPDFTYLNIEEIINYMTDDRSFFLFTSNKSADIVKNYCSVGDGSATGFLGNPVDPSDTTRDFSNSGNASCFPFYCGGSGHGAVDLNSKDKVVSGNNVYAMDGGIVSKVGDYSSNCYGMGICKVGYNSYGIFVTIDHGNGYKTLYAHFSQRLVNEGDKVSKGQLIGKVGKSGEAKGAHLHMELQDPSYSGATRKYAKEHKGAGLMNATLYINKNVSYVGQTQ